MNAIKRLSNGGFIATYRCTAACGHCLYASSPSREAQYADATSARLICEKLAAMGCRSLHIGGGEPFLDVDALCALIRAMNAAGVALDYVETNAFWAADAYRARTLLGRVAEAGLTAIMFSLCPYHAPYVPLEHVKTAIRAAQDMGVMYFVWQDRFAREVEALGDERRTHTLEEYERRFPGALETLPDRFGIRMLGRAALTHGHQARTPADTLMRDDTPCGGPLRTAHFHVDLKGRFIPPGCTGFAFPLDELDAIGGQRHPAMALLLRGGVKALAEAALQRGFKPHARYDDKCALCQHARSHLALESSGEFPELAPLGFYQELYG